MKKKADIISFIVQLVIAVFALIAIKLAMDFILNYYRGNIEHYYQLLVDNGTYYLYKLLSYDVMPAFAKFKIIMFIIIVLIIVTGMIAFHFNKNSVKSRKVIIVSSSCLPIAFSLLYPLMVGSL